MLLAKERVREAQEKLREFRRSIIPASLETYYRPTYDELAKTLSEEAAFFVDFKLNRDGAARLAVPSEVTYQYRPVAWPDDPTERGELRRLVCSHLFFFLKDISHSHRHHAPRTDTMTDVYDDDGTDNWRHRTIQGLYAHIIDMRRADRTDSSYNSLGVLAYARAFRNQSRLENAVGNLFGIDDTPLESSITSSFDHEQLRLSKRVERIERFQGGVLPAATLFLAYVALLVVADWHKPEGTVVSPALGDAADFLISYPVPIMVTFVLGACWYYLDPFGWIRSHIGWLTRLIQPYPQLIAGTALTLTGALLIVALYYLVHVGNIIPV